MTEKEQQFLFAELVPKLLTKILETHNYTWGDAWSRPQYKAHKPNSVHYNRMAVDLNLFTREGAYLDSTESHKPFGEFWEGLHPLCRWGGRFNDGNHYSLEWEGRK